MSDQSIKNYIDELVSEDTEVTDKSDLEEPVLMYEDRLTTLPLRHHDIWELYKKHMSTFWTAEEIDLSKDWKDWEKLTVDEKYFIKHVLAFFASSDTIVNMNLDQRFTQEIQLQEAKYFYGFQTMMENIHSETYSLLLDTYVKDPEEKARLLNAVETLPPVTLKMEWAKKWINDQEASLATRLVAFAAVEGIFFSGSFCAIFWLKNKGLMPGLVFSNELISKDEGLHTDHAVLLYTKKIINKLSKEKIHEIIKDAVNIEKEFITDALPCALIGMNSELMKQYIEFVADRLVKQLGYTAIYNSDNPFPFMENISIENKGNFFERRIAEYSRAGIGKNKDDMEWGMDEDF